MSGAGQEERYRILVIEDDPDIAALVAYQLTRAGYRVETTGSGPEGLDSLQREIPDILILDRMLPGVSGDEVLHSLRQEERTRAVPVLVLTAKREQEERIEGLEMGADDYLTKPFSPRELVLRVDAIIRRVRQGGAGLTSQGRVIRAEALEVNLSAMTVTLDGEEVSLTPTEFRLLRTLLERRGRIQSRDQLINEAWASGQRLNSLGSRTVDMHIRRLRAKLGDVGREIETVRGFGYRFRAAKAKPRRTPNGA